MPRLYNEGDSMTVTDYRGTTCVATIDACWGDNVRVWYRDSDDNLTFTWFRDINGPRV